MTTIESLKKVLLLSDVEYRCAKVATMKITSTSTQRVKVTFPLAQDEEGYPPFCDELLWCIPTGPAECRVDSIPFYVRRIDLGDSIAVRTNEGG